MNENAQPVGKKFISLKNYVYRKSLGANGARKYTTCCNASHHISYFWHAVLA